MKSTRTCKNIDKTLRSNILKLQAFGAVAAFFASRLYRPISWARASVWPNCPRSFPSAICVRRGISLNRMGRVFSCRTRPQFGRFAPQNIWGNRGSFLAAKGPPVMHVAKKACVKENSSLRVRIWRMNYERRKTI